MGFFDKKNTVTAEQLGLNLAVYAFEVTNQSYEDISQILGEDVIFPELLLFHHWGAQVQIGHLKLDKSTRDRVLTSMVAAFLAAEAQAIEAALQENPDAEVGVTQEGSVEFYRNRMVDYWEAFEPLMKEDPGASDPFFPLTSLLVTNFTGDTEGRGFIAQMALVPWLTSYLETSSDFIKEFRVTGT